MIALLISLLFSATALIAILSLSDSAIRGRNAWRAIKREMAMEQNAQLADVRSDVVAFHDVRPIRRGYQANTVATVRPQLAVAA